MSRNFQTVSLDSSVNRGNPMPILVEEVIYATTTAHVSDPVVPSPLAAPSEAVRGRFWRLWFMSLPALCIS